MKPEAKLFWESEDDQLHREFADVSEIWRERKSELPEVPSALDRKIRNHVGLSIETEIVNSWVLGAVPKLALAALLLFGIGIMFVLGTE